MRAPSNGATGTWLPEVEMARGVAILAVLLIHVTGLPVETLRPGTPAHTFYGLLNRGAQFAVPLFLMISALLAAYRHGPEEKVDWRGFYLRKWRQVVVPYLAWTTVYVLARVLVLRDLSFLTASGLARTYLLGMAWFHLYFMSVLLQFYVLLPPLLRLFRAVRPGFAATAVVAGGLQYAFLWVNRLYIYERFPYPGYIVLSYLFPLAVGLWLGQNTERWAAWWRVWAPVSATAAVGAGTVYVGLELARANGHAVSTLALRMAWHLYVTAVGAATVFLCRRLAPGAGPMSSGGQVPAQVAPAAWAAGRFRSAAASALARLGRVSFGVYLVHPLFLGFWRLAWTPSGPAAVSFSVWGSLVFILAGSWAVVAVLGRTPLGPFFLGSRERPRPGSLRLPGGRRGIPA